MKIKVVIPTEVRDIKVGQYRRYIETVENEDMKDDAKLKRIISIFTNIEEDLVGKMTQAEVQQINAGLYAVLAQAGNEKPLIRRFKILDTEFGFIPNIEKASFDEYTDLDSYFGITGDLNRFLAVCYRPVTKLDKLNGVDVYNIEDYENTDKYAEVLDYAPLTVALGAVSFFEDIGITLLKAIPSYLESQMASQEVQDHLRDLQASGDGIELTTSSVMEGLQKYQKLVEVITSNA